MLTAIECRALVDACVILRAFDFCLLAEDVRTAQIMGPAIPRAQMDGVFDAAVALFDIGTTHLASVVASLYMHLVREGDCSPATADAIEHLYKLMTSSAPPTAAPTVEA